MAIGELAHTTENRRDFPNSNYPAELYITSSQSHRRTLNIKQLY